MLDNKSALIFDFDGTLVDTMCVFADVASQLIVENYKIDQSKAREMYLKTSGLPFYKQLEIMFPNHELNARVADIYEQEKLEATSDIDIDEETIGALNCLKEWEYGLILSSNNFQHNIDNFIIKNELGDLFDLALGHKENFSKGKEHFDYIIREFGEEREGLIFVGDSLHDLILAKENNIDFIGKLGTFSKKDFVEYDKNIKVIQNISELIK